MLVLAALHDLLIQVLSLPDLHTAVLLSPEGQLISVACKPTSLKDDIRVVAGLSAQAWSESQDVPKDESMSREILMDSEVCSDLMPYFRSIEKSGIQGRTDPRSPCAEHPRTWEKAPHAIGAELNAQI